MSEKLAWAYGVFKIPLYGDEVRKFPEKWREFLDAFKDKEGQDFHTVVVKSQWDDKEAKLIDAVLDILGELFELETAVEAESQFVEALLEDDDW